MNRVKNIYHRLITPAGHVFLSKLPPRPLAQTHTIKPPARRSFHVLRFITIFINSQAPETDFHIFHSQHVANICERRMKYNSQTPRVHPSSDNPLKEIQVALLGVSFEKDRHRRHPYLTLAPEMDFPARLPRKRPKPRRTGPPTRSSPVSK